MCRITPGEEVLRKEAFFRPLSKPIGLELWGGERGGSQPGVLAFLLALVWRDDTDCRLGLPGSVSLTVPLTDLRS